MHSLAQTLPAELKLLVFKAAAEDCVLVDRCWVASLRLVCRTADVDIAPIFYRSIDISEKNYSAIRDLAIAERDEEDESRHVLSRVKHVYFSQSLEYVDFDAALFAAVFTSVTDVAGSEPISEQLAYHAPHRFPLPDIKLFISPRYSFFQSGPTAFYSRTRLVVTLADLPSAETTEDSVLSCLDNAPLVTHVAISVLGYAQTQGVPAGLDAALRVARECAGVLCVVVDVRAEPSDVSEFGTIESFLAALRDPRICLRVDTRLGAGGADPIRDCLEGRNIWREARQVCESVKL